MGKTVKQLTAQFGKDYKDPEIATVGLNIEDPKRLPTGLFAFDLATGGGIPEGRISIFYGTEDSMKTTLCLKLIAQAQRKYPDKTATFVDVEGVLGKKWSQTLGVDIEKLAYIKPDNAEQVVDMVEGLLYADDISVIVIDSLAALVTQYELNKSAEDAIVGKSGLIVNKLYRKVVNALGKCDRAGKAPTLILVNQIRYKIGAMGNPETQPGGPAFQFGSSLTVRCRGADVMDSNVSKTLPAYKEVNIIVKKYKVPILAKKAVVTIATQPIEEYGLSVGQAYDWNTLLSYLKSLELLKKVDKEWELTHPGTGEVELFKKQDHLKKKVFSDVDYGQSLKSAVIEAMMDSDEVIE